MDVRDGIRLLEQEIKINNYFYYTQVPKLTT